MTMIVKGTHIPNNKDYDSRKGKVFEEHAKKNNEPKAL